MSETLARVEARIESARQLSTVVSAMRNIAAVRARDARWQIDGIRAYAETIGAAIGEALTLALAPETEHSRQNVTKHMVIVFCSEQGFVGAFNDRVFDAVAALHEGSEGGYPELLVVGDRGVGVAAERKMEVGWSSPMIVRPEQAAGLAGQIAEVILDRMPPERGLRVEIMHAQPGAQAGARLSMRRIIPFDYSRFQTARSTSAPLTTLSPRILVERLSKEYIFAELCEAIILSFMAENEDRVRAMTAAGTNIDKSLDTLLGLSRRLRQEAITTEIVELAAGTLSN